MNNIDINVSISLSEAEERIYNAVVNSSLSGELIDRYVINKSKNSLCIINVFEKHYFRTGNQLTLTVIYDNTSGFTRVHAISGGGRRGLFNLDLGASNNFTSSVYSELEGYKI